VLRRDRDFKLIRIASGSRDGASFAATSYRRVSEAIEPTGFFQQDARGLKI